MSLVTKPRELVAEAEASGTPGLLGRAPHWERVALGDVADILNGAPFTSEGFNTSGRGKPLIRIRDLDGWTGTSFEGEFDDRYLVRAGDLLVGMDGDFNVRRWEGPDGLLNQRVCRVDVRDPDLFHEPFLALVLPAYLAAINAATSAITVKHLSSRDLAAIPLPLPPLPAQRQIASVLDEQLARIGTVAAELSQLSDKFRAADASLRIAALRIDPEGAPEGAAPSRSELQQPSGALSRRRAPVAPTNPPVTSPSAWSLVSLSDLAWDIDYGTSQRCAHDGRGVQVLRIPNIANGSVDTTDLKAVVDTKVNLDASLVVPGDLLVVRTNGSRDLIGRCAPVERDQGMSFASYLIRFRLLVDFVDPRWVSLVLMSPHWRRLIEGRAATSAGQYNLSIGKLEDVPIPLPPLDAQKRILASYQAAAEQLEGQRQAVKKQLRRLDGLRRSLLGDAVEGRLVRRNPADETAALLQERIRSKRVERADAGGRASGTVRRTSANTQVMKETSK